MEEIFKQRSGNEIPKITTQQAESRHLLSEHDLRKLHLISSHDPIAYTEDDQLNRVYYYDAQTVTEAPVEQWYRAAKVPKPVDPITLEDGTVIGKMSVKTAGNYGYFTKLRLSQMHYDATEPPVAYTLKKDKSLVLFYDKKTAVRRPLMCVRCGEFVRYRRKLCEACYAKDLAARRAEGDEYRNAAYHMKRERVLFFDLELTGVYDHDEILSISITDGTGKIIMDTLVRPVHTKKWKRTESIHGITPEMVQDAPTLADLTPEIKSIFEKADILIAYGIATDFSHIKKIYETEAERQMLRKRTGCAATEYVRYISEHEPELKHSSLTDAMAYFNIAWDGVAHTSIADTIGCAKVWEKLFPNYYED